MSIILTVRQRRRSDSEKERLKREDEKKKLLSSHLLPFTTVITAKFSVFIFFLTASKNTAPVLLKLLLCVSVSEDVSYGGEAHRQRKLFTDFEHERREEREWAFCTTQFKASVSITASQTLNVSLLAPLFNGGLVYGCYGGEKAS